MKTVIKQGEIQEEVFKCLVCDCKFKSDEYLLNEENYDADKKTKLRVIDHCPKCLSNVYKKI
jgi:hypothetical protein